MADTKIAAILRAGAYSPNHIGNDAAILNLTCEQLRKRGCQVKTYSEEQLIAGPSPSPSSSTCAVTSGHSPYSRPWRTPDGS